MNYRKLSRRLLIFLLIFSFFLPNIPLGSISTVLAQGEDERVAKLFKDLQFEVHKDPPANDERFQENESRDPAPLLPDEKVTVEKATYEPPLSEAVLFIKAKTLHKQGLPLSDDSRSKSSFFSTSDIKSPIKDLDKIQIERLVVAGASKLDVYWINYLMLGAPRQTPIELLKWKQEDVLTWEQIDGKLHISNSSKNAPSSVQDATYYDAVISQFGALPSVSSAVYGEEELLTPVQLQILATNLTAFDMTVAGVIDGLVARSQFNHTNKPQYSDRNATDETIDPASGSLTWKENQIHLPGRDGLDLDIGIMYSSNQGHSFIVTDHYSGGV